MKKIIWNYKNEEDAKKLEELLLNQNDKKYKPHKENYNKKSRIYKFLKNTRKNCKK